MRMQCFCGVRGSRSLLLIKSSRTALSNAKVTPIEYEKCSKIWVPFDVHQVSSIERMIPDFLVVSSKHLSCIFTLTLWPVYSPFIFMLFCLASVHPSDCSHYSCKHSTDYNFSWILKKLYQYVGLSKILAEIEIGSYGF